MTDKPKKLSDTAHVLLAAAANRDDHLLRLPQLPVAVARQVVRSILNAGFAEEVPAPVEDVAYLWRKTENGCDLMLRVTDLGLDRVRNEVGGGSADADGGQAQARSLAFDVPPLREPQAGQDAARAPTQPHHHAPMPATRATEPSDTLQAMTAVPVRSARQNTIRQAAQALLKAWDASASVDFLDKHVAALRAALARQASASTVHPRPPRDTNLTKSR